MDYGWRWGERRVVLALLFLLLGVITVYIIIQYYLLTNNRTANLLTTVDSAPSRDYLVDTSALINELYGYRWTWVNDTVEVVSSPVADVTYDGFASIVLQAIVSLPNGQGSAALSFAGNPPEVLRTGEMMANGAKLIKIDAHKVLLEKDAHWQWLPIAANCSPEKISSATQLGIVDLSAKECVQ